MLKIHLFSLCSVNVKKVKFILEQAMKAQMGVEVWLYSFFDLGARCGLGGQCHHTTAPLP